MAANLAQASDPRRRCTTWRPGGGGHRGYLLQHDGRRQMRVLRHVPLCIRRCPLWPNQLYRGSQRCCNLCAGCCLPNVRRQHAPRAGPQSLCVGCDGIPIGLLWPAHAGYEKFLLVDLLLLALLMLLLLLLLALLLLALLLLLLLLPIHY